MTENKLLTAEQAIDRLHAVGMTDLKPKFIKNQFDRGLIPFVKVGNIRRVRSDVLESIIAGWLDEAL